MTKRGSRGSWEVKLDVGCGERPRGDVNCDVYKNWNPQIRDQKGPYYVDVKKIPSFILFYVDAVGGQNKSFQCTTLNHEKIVVRIFF